jgi:hypothetical protein
MAVMRELHPRYGDVATEWDVLDKASVDAAIEVFERHMADGKVAFARKGGTDSPVTREFDPAADEIIVFSQFAGG